MGEGRWQEVSLRCCSSGALFRQGLSLAWSSPSRFGSLGTKLQGSAHPLPAQHWEYNPASMPSLFTQVLGIRLRPSHSCSKALYWAISQPGACPLISFALALGDRNNSPSAPLTRSDSAGAVASGKTRSQTLNNCTVSLLGSPSCPGAAPSQSKEADLVAPIGGVNWTLAQEVVSSFGNGWQPCAACPWATRTCTSTLGLELTSGWARPAEMSMHIP